VAGRGEAAGVRDRPAGCATDREVGVVAAVLAAGSEKAAAHRLGLSHSTVKHHLANARSKVGPATTAQLVWILAPRLPGPEATALAAEWRARARPDSDASRDSCASTQASPTDCQTCSAGPSSGVDDGFGLAMDIDPCRRSSWRVRQASSKRAAPTSSA
jgi:DNA-binding CsgD family transcriptional regulator